MGVENIGIDKFENMREENGFNKNERQHLMSISKILAIKIAEPVNAPNMKIVGISHIWL